MELIKLIAKCIAVQYAWLGSPFPRVDYGGRDFVPGALGILNETFLLKSFLGLYW